MAVIQEVLVISPTYDEVCTTEITTFLIETFINLQGVYALYEKAYERADYI